MPNTATSNGPSSPASSRVARASSTRSASADGDIPSDNRSSPVLMAIQPSQRAARRMPPGRIAPIQIGGRGCCAGCGPMPDVVDRVVRAGSRDGLAAQERVHDPDRLVHLRDPHRRRPVLVERLVVRLVAAGAHAQDQPPAAEPVEGRRRLRHQLRPAARQHDDRGEEREPLGRRRRSRERHERVGRNRALREPQRVPGAEPVPARGLARLGQPDERQRIREVAERRDVQREPHATTARSSASRNGANRASVAGVSAGSRLGSSAAPG